MSVVKSERMESKFDDSAIDRELERQLLNLK